MKIIQTLKDKMKYLVSSFFNFIQKVTQCLKDRWKSSTPKFFKNVLKIGLSISAIALAIHLAVSTAGAIEPQWWLDLYPYLIGIPAGMAAVAKLTKEDK